MMKKAILAFLVGLVSVAILVSAASFDFKGTTDKMSINEEMGDVLEAITVTHLPDLKSGSSTTKEGSTKYAQYLRFKDATTVINASAVQFVKATESGEIGEFLVVEKGTAVTD